MSKIKTLADIIDRTKKDTDNTITALRLQAMAWRICTMISLARPQEGATLAQWLLFKTVPWVDGAALETFIAKWEADAATCGKHAGVFT